MSKDDIIGTLHPRKLGLSLCVVALLTACGTPHSLDKPGHYQVFHSALNFEETVARMDGLVSQKRRIANMTRTGGCYKVEESDVAVRYVCGHTPGFIKQDPKSSLFAVWKHIAIEQGNNEQTVVKMTWPPNLLFGEYTPANRDILQAAEIPVR